MWAHPKSPVTGCTVPLGTHDFDSSSSSQPTSSEDQNLPGGVGESHLAPLLPSLLPLLGPWSQSFSSTPWRGHPGASPGRPASSRTLHAGPFTRRGQGRLPAPQLCPHFSTYSKSIRDSSLPAELSSNSPPVRPRSTSALLPADVTDLLTSLFQHLVLQAHTSPTCSSSFIGMRWGENRHLLLPRRGRSDFRVPFPTLPPICPSSETRVKWHLCQETPRSGKPSNDLTVSTQSSRTRSG